MPVDCTVFIVDDDSAVRDSMVALVRSKGVSAQGYGSAEEFLTAYTGATSGCLVTDVRMEGMNGLELQETLRQRGARLPTIMITGHGDIPTAVRAMAAGAFTFLEKPCRDHELWASIRKALQFAAARESEQTRKSEIKSRLEQLSPEERCVLKEMVAGKPNKVIALELDIGLRTVELRRANVLKKLQAENLAELVRLVLLAEEPDTGPRGP